ncbi:hypothetical protein TREES_T100014100 [Tupaia chinensis]|uniref:Uncharacterized protein n=1 Tax=Tupaia chinensis TaxID=246437 RepID=L9KKJ0_TUPCH|nr:hypothetical protein TREES_T100014100 [Tupaia chinensis]
MCSGLPAGVLRNHPLTIQPFLRSGRCQHNHFTKETWQGKADPGLSAPASACHWQPSVQRSGQVGAWTACLNSRLLAQPLRHPGAAVLVYIGPTCRQHRAGCENPTHEAVAVLPSLGAS